MEKYPKYVQTHPLVTNLSYVLFLDWQYCIVFLKDQRHCQNCAATGVIAIQSTKKNLEFLKLKSCQFIIDVAFLSSATGFQ